MATETAGKLRRRCVLCEEYWVAKHPYDPNIFCPHCTDKLRDIVKKGEADEEVPKEIR